MQRYTYLSSFSGISMRRQELDEAADSRAAPGAAPSPKTASEGPDRVAELAEKLAALSAEDRARLAKLLDPEG